MLKNSINNAVRYNVTVNSSKKLSNKHTVHRNSNDVGHPPNMHQLHSVGIGLLESVVHLPFCDSWSISDNSEEISIHMA